MVTITRENQYKETLFNILDDYLFLNIYDRVLEYEKIKHKKKFNKVMGEITKAHGEIKKLELHHTYGTLNFEHLCLRDRYTTMYDEKISILLLRFKTLNKMGWRIIWVESFAEYEGNPKRIIYRVIKKKKSFKYAFIDNYSISGNLKEIINFIKKKIYGYDYDNEIPQIIT